MSNGWYQLEHNRPRKGVPYLPGGTPRREPYIPVTRSTASEPPHSGASAAGASRPPGTAEGDGTRTPG